MVSHAPFRLILTIGTPIILRDHPPSLDALVYAALSAHVGRSDALIETMKSYLTWHSHGFFHAGGLRFVVTDRSSVVAKTAVRLDAIRHKLRSDMIAPTGQNGAYNRVVTSGGPYKTRMIQRRAYSSPYVIFDGRGDKRAVADMLRYYLPGVGYDAKNAGFGEIVDIDAVDQPADASIMLASGALNRIVPADFAESAGLTGIPDKARILPPYYGPDRVDVVRPERIRLIHQSELI